MGATCNALRSCRVGSPRNRRGLPHIEQEQGVRSTAYLEIDLGMIRPGSDAQSHRRYRNARRRARLV